MKTKIVAVIVVNLSLLSLILMNTTQAADILPQGDQAVSRKSDVVINSSVTTYTLYLPIIQTPSLGVVFANYASVNHLCFGISCNMVDTVAYQTLAVAIDDVNNDGNIDAVFANAGFETFQPSRVCFGNGAGSFSGCSNISGPTNSLGVALGDLNGDNNVDAVFAEGGDDFDRPNKVCLGNGTGGFTCANVDSNSEDSTDVALVDLNEDNKLDAVFTNYNQPNRVCLGNGVGGFTSCNNVSSDRLGSEGVALGDLNGDDKLDVVFANLGSNDPHRRCLGDGAGSFTSCATVDVSLPSVFGRDVDLGDLNGDNHLDAVFANSGSQNKVCLGKGDGTFNSCSNLNADSRTSQDIVLVDMNNDSNLDAIIANSLVELIDNGLNEICFGDGTGGFNTCNPIGAYSNDSLGVAVGKFN